MQQIKRRNAGVAFLLSLILPGLGQMYNGQLARGAVLWIAIMLVWIPLGLAGLMHTFYGQCAIVFCALGLQVGVAVDALLGARRVREIPLRRYNRWYYYAVVFVVYSFAADVLYDLVRPLYFRQVRSFAMPAASMEPTLQVGDYFIARVNPYVSQGPARNDVVIFPFPEDPSKLFVKRIVGLEGESLEIRDKKVFVDGKLLEEPWAVHLDSGTLPRSAGPRDNYGPTAIPQGAVFVMGDNRDYNHDSRFWGFVQWREIIGKPLYIYWSEDWKRMGRDVK